MNDPAIAMTIHGPVDAEPGRVHVFKMPPRPLPAEGEQVIIQIGSNWMGGVRREGTWWSYVLDENWSHVEHRQPDEAVVAWMRIEDSDGDADLPEQLPLPPLEEVAPPVKNVAYLAALELEVQHFREEAARTVTVVDGLQRALTVALGDVKHLRLAVNRAMGALSNGDQANYDDLEFAYKETEPGHPRAKRTGHGVATYSEATEEPEPEPTDAEAGEKAPGEPAPRRLSITQAFLATLTLQTAIASIAPGHKRELTTELIQRFETLSGWKLPTMGEISPEPADWVYAAQTYTKCAISWLEHLQVSALSPFVERHVSVRYESPPCEHSAAGDAKPAKEPA